MSEAKRDLLRAAAILAVSTILGLASNGLSAKPLRIFSLEGPGAWSYRAPRISVDQLKSAWAEKKALLLLDVRSEASFASGHAPLAVSAPAPEFIRHYDRLGLASVLKAAEGVVVVCESEDCSAGDRVADQLRGLGHREVRVLQGGWEAGRRAGLESGRP